VFVRRFGFRVTGERVRQGRGPAADYDTHQIVPAVGKRILRPGRVPALRSAAGRCDGTGHGGLAGLAAGASGCDAALLEANADAVAYLAAHKARFVAAVAPLLTELEQLHLAADKKPISNAIHLPPGQG
jgi:hypothetical protein